MSLRFWSNCRRMCPSKKRNTRQINYMFKYQIKGETRKKTPKHTLNAPNTELMPAVSSTLSCRPTKYRPIMSSVDNYMHLNGNIPIRILSGSPLSSNSMLYFTHDLYALCLALYLFSSTLSTSVSICDGHFKERPISLLFLWQQWHLLLSMVDLYRWRHFFLVVIVEETKWRKNVWT